MKTVDVRWALAVTSATKSQQSFFNLHLTSFVQSGFTAVLDEAKRY